MKKIILILIMAITVSGCTTKTTKNGNPKNINKNVPTEKNIKSNPSQSPLVFQQKKCGFFKDFIDQKWFSEVGDVYKKNFPKEYNEFSRENTFYNDYSDLNRKQACIYDDYFIFTPGENAAGEGAFYTYNINSKKIQKSPSNTSYRALELTGIGKNFVYFEGVSGTGECFWGNYGKYYFKDNKIEIYKTCNGCATKKELSQGGTFSFKDKDCKNVIKIYK